MRTNPCNRSREAADRKPSLAAILLSALALLLGAVTAHAATPRPAPDFTFEGVGGKKSLRSLRGQPVVLVIAKSPRTKAFRKEIESLEELRNYTPEELMTIRNFGQKSLDEVIEKLGEYGLVLRVPAVAANEEIEV